METQSLIYNELFFKKSATIFLAIAILHTFLSGWIKKIADRYPEGSVMENTLHLLAEVEAVFGLWATVFIIYYFSFTDKSHTIMFLSKLNFTEPIFVFVIMVLCATKPILVLAEKIMTFFAGILPVSKNFATFFSFLYLGPLLGSFITEPAAMTIVASLILAIISTQKLSNKFRYSLLATLFLNISIGGSLTHFAAPPVIMVAGIWNWDLAFMFFHFGWKAMISMGLTTLLFFFINKDELKNLQINVNTTKSNIPFWLIGLHLLFLVLVILNMHEPILFAGLFLLFLGVVKVTKEYQSKLSLEPALLVGFFLAGLVVLGTQQGWWLTSVLGSLSDVALFTSAIGLTAVIDNAALTLMGAQVPNLSDSSKYLLVAGSLIGGGLTIIANAPNPIGFSILSQKFSDDGFSSISLLKFCLLPTLITALVFWFL